MGNTFPFSKDSTFKNIFLIITDYQALHIHYEYEELLARFYKAWGSRSVTSSVSPECLWIKSIRRSFASFYYWSFTRDKSINSPDFWRKRKQGTPESECLFNQKLSRWNVGLRISIRPYVDTCVLTSSFNLVICRKWLEKNWKIHFSLSWGYAHEGFAGVFASFMPLETVSILCRWDLETVPLCFGSRQFSACDKCKDGERTLIVFWLKLCLP